jgi:hypothetical protein
MAKFAHRHEPAGGAITYLRRSDVPRGGFPYGN